MNAKSLNVFFVIDTNFIIHFTVSLTSLLENNRDINVSVYVLHDLDNVSVLDNINKFFTEKYFVTLHFKFLGTKKFDNVPNNFEGTEYISKAAYFRLLLGELIPNEVKSGLYLDCDTIVTGSLEGLIELNFNIENRNEEYSLLAVSDNKEIDNIERLKKLGISSQFYFNSGVMLINLKKWRSDNTSKALIDILEKYQKYLKWLDQDVLNIHFIKDCGKLNPTYNTVTSRKASTVPLIVHFSGQSKPWHYVNNGPYKALYWKYLKLTIFKNEKLERITLVKMKRKYSQLVKRLVKIESD